MSENFLSFIVNASPKAVDVGSDVPADTGRVASQGADFNSVLAKEQAKSQSPKTDAQPAAEADTASAAKPEVDAANAPSEAAADREAPVALPNAAANGNPLPELSIHSRALQVGRVILTTANPKVSEESLSQFARAQGGVVPELKPLEASPSASDNSLSPVGSVLQGLVSNDEVPGPGVPAQVSASVHSDLPSQTDSKSQTHSHMRAAVAGGALNPAPHGALDARQRFMQQANWSGATPPAMDPKTAGLKSELDEMVTKNSDALAQTGQTRQTELMQQMKQTNEGTNPELAQAKATLSTILSGQVEGLADRALAGVEPVVEQGSSNPQPQSQGNPSAPPMANANSTLIQAPAGNAPVSLADALLSADPAQMQSRLQPYQVWAQRFGEVLAQKLALAVKEGNWTVKLNLNPAALGPVGIELQVGERGIEGQIAANDANVRQLLGDSMPRLRQSLEALVGDGAGVNIELSDDRDRRAKREDSQEIELSMDLLAEELIPSEQQLASGNILRDGLNVFV
jgi:flagellar hook-length control protein FliK